MELRDLLRLCNGRQVHDLIFFQKRLSEALKRIKLAVCERNILFWEQRGTGRVTVGVGLPLRYDADDGGFCLEEPDVICVSFHNEATGQIYDYRLTYTWHEESDGPMISNDERIRDAQ